MLRRILILFPFIAIMALGMIAAALNTLTYDEAQHYRYGEQLWRLDAKRFDEASMPVNALHVIPQQINSWISQKTGFDLFHWVVQKTGFEKTVGPDEIKVYAGRLVNLLFSPLLALLIYLWTRQLYGGHAAVCALWIYAFSPTFLAMSPLTKVDLAATFFITLAVYTFWRWSLRPVVSTLLWASLALGFAQISKYNAAYLFLCYPIILALQSFRSKKQPFTARHALKFLVGTVVMMATVTIIINTAFLWHHVGLRIDQIQFQSHLFQTLQRWLDGLRIPVAYPFYQGLDMVKYIDDHGLSRGLIYLLGKNSLLGFPGYYFVAFSLKETVPFILLTIATIISFFFRSRRRTFLTQEVFLVTPLIVYWIYFNFFFHTQTGIRYLLPIYPFLIVLMGWLFQHETIWRHRTTSLTLVALLAWHVISPLTYTPNFLSYFNELIGSRLNAYRFLGNSDLCWGQNGLWLKRYLRKHPDAKVDPLTPTPGLVVVDVNRLLGITDSPEHFWWIRENYRPIDHVSHAHLVFSIPDDQKFRQVREKWARRKTLNPPPFNSKTVRHPS